MLYAIVGERNRGKAKQKEILKVLEAKQPEAEIVRMDEENFSESMLDEMVASQGLFSPKYVIVLDGLCVDKEHEGFVIERMKDLAEVEHAVLILESKATAALKKALEKYAKKVYEIEDSEPKRGYENSFQLAEAFGRRDKVAMWELFTKEKDEMEIEKIHGGLVWQAKSMLLAMKTKTAVEADMKDYPYQKAKGFAKNYKVEELENILCNLVSIYHDAHRGGMELDLALEKLILTI